MKLQKILYLLSLLSIFSILRSYGQSNYVQSRVPRRAVTTITKLNTLTPLKDSVENTISYFDGLGRAVQTIQVQGSFSGKDVVQPFAYDGLGREAVKYLPYALTTVNNGALRAGAITSSGEVYQYYQPSGGGSQAQQTNGVVRTGAPFSVTGFEASPLNRVQEQGAPGESWQLPGTGDAGSAGHTARMVYTTNDQGGFSSTPSITNLGSHKVALYTASINANGSRVLGRAGGTATYNSGELYLTVTRDENWQPADGCGGTSEEYKDKEGHVVLKRIYNKKPLGTSSFVLEMYSTYYVYDALGNLCFVLPPATAADNATSISAAVMDGYGYQYRYDRLNRMTEKKLPGKGWEYIVYNRIDQPVATQDSVQRMKSPQEWTFTRYDSRGRAVITGVFPYTATAGTNTRLAVQAQANAVSPQWETAVATGNGYTSVTWPASFSSILSINYYDSYTGIPGLPTGFDQHNNVAYTYRLNGLLTATKTAVLGSSDMLWTVPYYNEKGMVVRSFSQHYLGGASSLSIYNYDDITTDYNFNDQPVKVIRKHYAKNSGGSAAVLALTVTENYTLDHKGRKKYTLNQLKDGANASQANTVLSATSYNETGQLIKKRLHGLSTGGSYLQTVDYRYNPRGWLSSINNSSLTGDGGYTNNDTNDKFGMELSYEATTTAAPQYNGNIAGVKWKSGVVSGITPLPQAFDYEYDGVGRLTSAVSSTSGTKSGFYNEYLKYNSMGSITALVRYEKVGGVRTQIDSLLYTYSANRLTRVDDAAAYTGDAGFVDAVQVASEYTYDGNGNARKDLNKGISSITYNMLNLPLTFTKGTQTITYTYDAGGRKLRKVVTSGSTTTATDYINGIQYSTTGSGTPTLDFLQTEEGRARKSGSVYKYEYDLEDHLGNARVTLTWDPSDATQLTPLVLQENDYYAFGLSIKSLEPVAPSPKNLYLYNGKELQDETGLYDYGARFYDPVIGRWTSIDPHAEKYKQLTPYNYVANDPLKFIDEDGRDIILGRNTVDHRALNKNEVNMMMSGLQSMTNDKLKFNSKTGKVDIISSGKGQLVKGTELIRNLIGSEKNMTINYARGKNGDQSGASTSATSGIESKTTDGVGTDVTVSIGKGHFIYGQKDGLIKQEVLSIAEMMDHELIHAWAGMNGDQVNGKTTNSYTFPDGRGKVEELDMEEKQTMDGGRSRTDNKGNPYTSENELRKEQGKSKRLNYSTPNN